MATRSGDIRVAYEIATMLDGKGYRMPDAGSVLAMAMAILAAGDPRAHREFTPLVKGFVEAAQIAFDALKEAEMHKGGTA